MFRNIRPNYKLNKDDDVPMNVNFVKSSRGNPPYIEHGLRSTHGSNGECREG